MSEVIKKKEVKHENHKVLIKIEKLGETAEFPFVVSLRAYDWKNVRWAGISGGGPFQSCGCENEEEAGRIFWEWYVEEVSGIHPKNIPEQGILGYIPSR